MLIVGVSKFLQIIILIKIGAKYLDLIYMCNNDIFRTRLL